MKTIKVSLKAPGKNAVVREVAERRVIVPHLRGLLHKFGTAELTFEGEVPCSVFREDTAPLAPIIRTGWLWSA